MKTENTDQGITVSTDKKSKLTVTYFQRKRRVSSYSMESIFDDVRVRLKGNISSYIRVAPFMSNGIFRRIGIMLDAMFHQSEINHVTGDINFLALCLRKKRTIVTIHDCGDFEKGRGMRGWLLRKIWISWPTWRCARVTTVSEKSRDAIMKIAKCDPSKVVIITNAVSEDLIYKPKPQLSSPPRILQVGASVNKNLERVIEAIAEIPCVLAIVGELTMKQKEKLELTKIEYENHMHISNDELREQYELSDLVVFASTFEGFGMPIVEAQKVGRAVVTSNVSSMPEIAGSDACLVDPLSVDSIRNGIRKVLTGSEYRRCLIREGLINATRFDAGEVANQYYTLYKKIYLESKD